MTCIAMQTVPDLTLTASLRPLEARGEDACDRCPESTEILLSLSRRLYHGRTVICTPSSGNADISMLHSSRLTM